MFDIFCSYFPICYIPISVYILYYIPASTIYLYSISVYIPTVYIYIPWKMCFFSVKCVYSFILCPLPFPSQVISFNTSECKCKYVLVRAHTNASKSKLQLSPSPFVTLRTVLVHLMARRFIAAIKGNNRRKVTLPTNGQLSQYSKENKEG